VQRSIFDEFLKRFVAKAEAMKFGDPLDPATEFGPLASKEHFTKVKGYIDSVEQEGGRIATGGVGQGWMAKPTVLVDMPLDSKQVLEEIFGPVVVIHPFDTEDEVVQLANGTPYGLDAQLFTENLHRAHRVSARLNVGTVWVNSFFIRDLRAPFGGAGASGVGREGGNFSREFFTEPKAVIMQIDPA
jgi:aminomuconate-semialdehyde/2-hydroxymuconate-6-semialdehyde dehydrogenase